MSLYLAFPDVPAFHQASYPKRRPARRDTLRPARPVVAVPVDHSLGTHSDLSYEQFVAGDFDQAALRVRA